MMKKTISILICAAIAMAVCSANPVNSRQARRQAALKLGTDESSLTMLMENRVAVASTSSSTPAYYMFNGNEGGFVIVSGDDALIPVLGYSMTGRIDAGNIPCNMQAWLEEVSEAVRTVRSDVTRKSFAEVAPGWEEREENTAGRHIMRAGTPVKMLDLPLWSQEHPYNWYCATFYKFVSSETQKSVTGCVSTAMSMVMRYYEWPPCGHGTLPDYDMPFYINDDYDYIMVHMEGHELGHEYKWSQMSMDDVSSYNTSTISDANKQIARLMYDCGIMMQSEYSYWLGTGAQSEMIPEMMIRYMYYQDCAEYVDKSSYTSDGWLSLIKGQLDQDMPVLYGSTARGGDGGHQYVVTGYDSDNKLYVNWGWGGECNGFFAVTGFRPDGTDLTANHCAIINLIPDKSYTPVPHETKEPTSVKRTLDVPSGVYLKSGKSGSAVFNGVELESGTIGNGSTFKMKAGILTNPTSQTITGNYRFDRYDYQDKFKKTIGTVSGSVSIAGGKTTTISGVSCSTDEVNVGDRVYLVKVSGRSSEKVDVYPDGITLAYYPMVPYYFVDAETNRVFNGAETYYGAVVEKEDNMCVATISYIVNDAYLVYEYIVQETD